MASRTVDIPVKITIDPRLTHMLEMQRRLQLMYNGGKAIEDFTDAERMEAIRDNVLACTDELHEALGETGWKPWATSNHINTAAFHSEMVDAWHFFMNLMLHSGMTADDLYRGYVDKNAKNIKRQADGYDGVSTKCPDCKRAYDDDAVTTPTRCSPITTGRTARRWGCTTSRSSAKPWTSTTTWPACGCRPLAGP
jgi:dimeric dUTPase (all-alpha-NTP-PPase superfamily)